MKASDLLIKALENEGVEYIFAVPGEENLDVVESLRNSNIKLITCRHEQSAGFMAATYGRLTGKAGVALSTLGPGATNFVTAVAYAQLGGMPALFITGQKPIKKSKQGDFQIIDVVSMMKPLTKFTKQIVYGNTIASTIRECFKVAHEERPGAVHIELPEDIAAEVVDDASVVYPSYIIRRPIADKKIISEAIKKIEASKRPLICIGNGGNRKRITKTLTDFIEKTRIPFFTTQMGKGVIDERNKYYMGTAALSDTDFIHCAVDRADLIINIGHDTVEKPPFIMKKNQEVIHINFLEAVTSDIYYPQYEVIGDIANTMWQLSESIHIQKHWDFEYYKKIQRKQREYIKTEDFIGRFPLTLPQIISAVRNLLNDEDIITLDNGMYKLWFARNYETRKSNTLLLDNALATMGAGLPSGIMAKMLNNDKHVVSIVGDGGFMMNSQELETAIRLGIDLVVIILKDNEYGMIAWKQENMGFKPFGLKYSNPDFVEYAKSYGAKGYTIKKEEDFPLYLSAALKSKGVHVLEVPIDYSDNSKVLNTGLKQKTCEL